MRAGLRARSLRVQTEAVARLLLVVSVAIAAGAGCGGAEPGDTGSATPRTMRVGIQEVDGGFAIAVRSLRRTATGWSVEASIENRTKARWSVGRPHSSAGTKFGLFVSRRPGELTAEFLERHARTTPTLLADTFEPALPRVFPPGESWSGRFAGPGAVPAGSYVAFAFGRFLTDAPPPGLPPRLLALTSRPVRVR